MKLPWPAANEAVNRTATPRPGVENRAQHAVAKKIEVVPFFDQERDVGLMIEVAEDCRCGCVVCAKSTGHQQFEEHEQRGFSATAYRA